MRYNVRGRVRALGCSAKTRREVLGRAKIMIECFFSFTWILGQALYWFYFKVQSDMACDECWKACLLRPVSDELVG